MNILGKRYIFFALSLLLILPGMVIWAIYGLPLAVDFKGGSLLEVQFPSGNLPTTEQVTSIYESYGRSYTCEVQPIANSGSRISSHELPPCDATVDL